MSDADRIRDLERVVSEQARNSAGQFVRLASGGTGDAGGPNQVAVITKVIFGALRVGGPVEGYIDYGTTNLTTYEIRNFNIVKCATLNYGEGSIPGALTTNDGAGTSI